MKCYEKKLKLNKKIISTLSESEAKLVKGGEGNMWTTSYDSCTGFTCCTPYTTTPYDTTTIVYCTLLHGYSCQSTTLTGC
ncbi:hypothetical protein SAMN05216436_11936 [bacterium A37T11]|nr:hypothetical protein SAMN05216436_11936 [bacterium A37T11]